MDMISDHLATAWHLLEMGEYEAARAEFIEAIAVNPEESEALIGLGKALARLGQVSEALEVFEKALVLDPNNPEAHYGAGWAHYKRKEWHEAESHLNKAIALAPTPKYHLLAAECARKRRCLETTLRHLEIAHRLDPKSLGKQSRLALAYYRIFAGAERVVPLLGWAFLATLYSCTLSAVSRRWWFLAASLPFLVVSGWNFGKRRYRRAIWAFVLCVLWAVPAYLLVEWLLSR